MSQPFEVLADIRTFQKCRIILTAVELDLFTRLDGTPAAAADLAAELDADERALTRLLDCQVAFELLDKTAGLYQTTARGGWLSKRHPESLQPIAMHFNFLWPKWSRLTDVVRHGPNRQRPPVGERSEADLRAFIGGMHSLGRRMAESLAAELDLSPFRRLLDVGGASGSYTIAFLCCNPELQATLFDLERVIPMARERLAEAGLLDRVELVSGDFYRDELPKGCDLALLSAIIHQNGPDQNVALYGEIYRALEPGGVLLIRDHVMAPDRVHPPDGAVFAINMLLGTHGGDTYTFDEIREGLETVGFTDVEHIRHGEHMDSLVRARKPV